MYRRRKRGKREEDEDEEEEGNFDDEDDDDEEEEGEEEEGEVEEEPPPPIPPEDKELLFLIEFLVDTLTIFPENMNVENIDPCSLQGPTMVCLTFLHFPPMTMGEKDVDPDRRTGQTVIQYNSGKSLMFALTESQFEEPPPVYLEVNAMKEMPHAFRFPRLNIGKTKIQLSELFRQVFDKYDENPQKTVSKSIKDKYELMGDKGKIAGVVSLYIRLTCLGEKIMTEFHKGDDEDEPVLFKNMASNKVYECKETDKSENAEHRVLPGWGDERRKKPFLEEESEKPPDPEDEDFEEILAMINGSGIRIKVEKSKRKDPPREFHVSEFCECNVPLPQNLVAGLSDLSLSPASETSVNYKPTEPFERDKRVGIDSANQLVFQVPPEEHLAQCGRNRSIVYNVKTCNEGEAHGHRCQNKFRIITDNNPEGPPPKLPNDPDKDVFVLRVIKRGKKDKGKDTLELEFKTPKEKIVPPESPPYMREVGVGQDKGKKDKKRKKKKD